MKTIKAAPGGFHMPRKGTKTYLILKGMTRKSGLSIDEIEEITGWSRSSAYSAVSDDMAKRVRVTVRQADNGRYHVKLPAHVSL